MTQRTSRRVLLTLILTLFCSFPAYLVSRPSAGAIDVRRTGGNFPGERSCVDFGCHNTNPLNSGTGALSLTVDGTPIDQYEYTPGETVSMLVRITHPTASRWGFQMTARTSNGCAQAGAFMPGEQEVSIRSNTATFAPCGRETIEFPVHRFAKRGPNGVTYAVDWMAPAEDIGTVRFAVAGNAANGNGANTGDFIYSIQASVDPAALPPPPPPTVPAVLSMGVVMGNLLPTINAISGESIISIFGRDFAPDGVDNRDTALDPASGLVATNLTGVCVEIDGQRSPMFHVITEANPSDPSVDQVNVQAPTLMGAGPVSVVVISNCDKPDEQRSPAEPVQLSDRTPAFFLLEPILSLGPNPLVATHLDFSKIGDPNTHPGTTPAEPGEFIRIFGAGFGRTEPDVQAGEIPQNVPAVQDNNFLAPLVGDFKITIGGITLEGRPNVLAAGLSVCCAGLYEIVVEVPEVLPDGNHEVTAMIDGVSTPSGTFITVKSPSGSAPGADAPEGEEPGGNDATDDGGSGGDGSSGGGGDGDMSGDGGSGGGDPGDGEPDFGYLQIPGAGTRGPTLFPPTSSGR